MATFYHYTDAAGILAIIQSGKILKQEGSEHFALGEAVFLTRVINATKVDDTGTFYERQEVITRFQDIKSIAVFLQ